MPIINFPITHKFGIISNSQRLALEERLVQQTCPESTLDVNSHPTGRHFEVSEEFINRYNHAKGFDEKEKYELQANKLIERVKRRAGLKDGGLGTHVNVPVAWTELTQLAQCKGEIQEACLDVLVISLDQAPLNNDLISTLFFLAESTLYWLHTDVAKHPYMRVAELKLLKVGYLVFLRLYYHHMAGSLQDQHDLKSRLQTYLSGLAEYQTVYSPYPNALLCLRFMTEVGKIVISDMTVSEADAQVKEESNTMTQGSRGDEEHVIPDQTGGPSTARKGDTNQEILEKEDETVHNVGPEQGAVGQGIDNLLISGSRKGSLKKPEKKVNGAVMSVSMMNEGNGRQSREASATLSACVHDLSPSLWHALDVWRCTNLGSSGHSASLKSLLQCGTGISSENWVDTIVAMLILGEAAKMSVEVMDALQDLACGVTPPPLSPSHHTKMTTMTSSTENSDGATTLGGSDQTSSHTHKLSRIGEAVSTVSPLSMEQRIVMAQRRSLESQETILNMSQNADIELPNDDANAQMSGSLNVGVEKSWSWVEGTATPPHQWYVKTGTEFVCRRASNESSVASFTNLYKSNGMLGLHGWHWEVTLTYIDVLASICLCSHQSQIQKRSLLGSNVSVSNCLVQKRGVCPLLSSGLVDLAFYKAPSIPEERDKSDTWSWRVRHAAIRSLVMIYHSLSGDVNKDGLRSVAWQAIIQAKRDERHPRVLEALNIGEIKVTIPSKTPSTAVRIGAKLSAALTAIYLPPSPPPVRQHAPQKPPKSRSVPKGGKAPTIQHQLRTSLRDEIDLATALYQRLPDYYTRTSFDLRRIVEDQWRKELHEDVDASEQERLEVLYKQREHEEEKHLAMERVRQEKFSHSPSF